MNQNKNIKNYYHNDKLNRGYIEEENSSNVSVDKNQDTSFPLPPIEIISEYESIYPGTLDKILKLTEKEQEKRFLIEKAQLASNEKAQKLGRFFGVLIVAIICSTTYQIFLKDPIYSMIFAAIAFGAIFITSLLSCSKREDRGFRHFKKAPDFRKHKNTGDRKQFFKKRNNNRR